MPLQQNENQELETTESNPPEGGVQDAVATGVAEPVVATTDTEPEYLSSEELDALYDEDGNFRYEVDGTPCDAEGNPIPATRPGLPLNANSLPPGEGDSTVSEDAAQPMDQTSTPAPRTQFRSPFAQGLLTEEERTQAELLADPQVLSLIETIAVRSADRIVAARDQQRAMTRELGIPTELHEEVQHQMAQVEHLVPQQIRGTRAGANAALALAACSAAGEDGSVLEIMKRWSAVGQPLQARAAQPVVAAPQSPQVRPRQATPYMAPSARSTTPRPAPESVRTNRPSKTIGAVSADALSIIQRERNAIKNGR